MQSVLENWGISFMLRTPDHMGKDYIWFIQGPWLDTRVKLQHVHIELKAGPV